ncbi:MAG: hypothetical protein A3Q59_01565 [Methanomethylophilus alvi]|nr:MAG: hypothetical protein A3Q59_01565 [Methanomethylophilus alvi]
MKIKEGITMYAEGNSHKISRTGLIALVLSALLAISALPVLADNDSSDAASSATGTVDVSYYDGTSFNTATVNAFDLYQAVKSAESDLGYTVTSANAGWNVNMGTYFDINPDYGKIDSLNSSSDFHIYVYAYDDSTGTTMAWTEAHSAVGWYRPFSDYGTKICFYSADAEDGRGDLAGAANIVLSGTELSAATIDAALDERAMTDRNETFSSDNPYMYKFYLKDSTFDANGDEVETISEIQHHVYFHLQPMVDVLDEQTGQPTTKMLKVDMVRQGVTVIGYGSDAYMALNNALKAYNMGDGQRICVLPHTVTNPDGSSYAYNTYYSWISSILRTPTYSNYVSNPDGSAISEYWYWAQYTGAVNSMNYASYTLGYYSNLAGGFNDATSFGSLFSMNYEYSAMNIPA